MKVFQVAIFCCPETGNDRRRGDKKHLIEIYFPAKGYDAGIRFFND